MSADDLQKLREAHEAIKRDLRRLVGGESVFHEAKAELAKLRESLMRTKGGRCAPLVGAITGLAVVGVGYLAAEHFHQKPSDKWVNKVRHGAGVGAGQYR